MLRFALPIAAPLLLLAACGTTPNATTGEAAPSAAAATPNWSAHEMMLTQAGRADAPSLRMVEGAFGRADITRQDGAGATLTYRYDNCALMLLFSADALNEMRLAEAHPSARRAGEAAPTLQQCASEANARTPS